MSHKKAAESSCSCSCSCEMRNANRSARALRGPCIHTLANESLYHTLILSQTHTLPLTFSWQPSTRPTTEQPHSPFRIWLPFIHRIAAASRSAKPCILYVSTLLASQGTASGPSSFALDQSLSILLRACVFPHLSTIDESSALLLRIRSSFLSISCPHSTQLQQSHGMHP